MAQAIIPKDQILQYSTLNTSGLGTGLRFDPRTILAIIPNEKFPKIILVTVPKERG